jgi:hypothetical protein
MQCNIQYKQHDDLNSIKVGTFVKGAYLGSQVGAMQFICAYRSGPAAWFLGTDLTVGTIKHSNNATVINNDSLNWSDACACTWTVYLYLKSGTVTVENCTIPTQSEANMINKWVRNNGFPYWTSTRYDDSRAYLVTEHGNITYHPTSDLYCGVVPFAKISL